MRGPISLGLMSPVSDSHNGGSARTRTGLSWLIAWMRDLMADALDILNIPDHLDGAVTGLGDRGGPTRQHGPGGRLGVDRVGLTAAASSARLGWLTSITSTFSARRRRVRAAP